MFRQSLAAAAALAAVLLPLGAGAQGLVQPKPLLPYYDKTPFVIDFRPAINAAGTRIVFERQVLIDPTNKYSDYAAQTNLFIADLATKDPRALVGNVSTSLRPDWCWQTTAAEPDGKIAFDDDRGNIYVMPARPGAATPLNLSQRGGYPTWFPGCTKLAVDASGALQYGSHPQSSKEFLNPGPMTIKVDVATRAITGSLSGRSLWAGFPSVNPKTPSLIVFAGQQFFPPRNYGWGCDYPFTGYNQNCNYIYVADDRGTPPYIRPLDIRAPTNTYDHRYEGRAPTWSPNARWVAFESNRTCVQKLGAGAGLYAIYLQDAMGLLPARQVTDCKYNAQHAKWYREPVSGRQLLIVSVLLYPTPPNNEVRYVAARGIASLDVTDLLKPGR